MQLSIFLCLFLVFVRLTRNIAVFAMQKCHIPYALGSQGATQFAISERNLMRTNLISSSV